MPKAFPGQGIAPITNDITLKYIYIYKRESSLASLLPSLSSHMYMYICLIYRNIVMKCLDWLRRNGFGHYTPRYWHRNDVMLRACRFQSWWF